MTGKKPKYPVCFLTNGGGVTEQQKAEQLSEWLDVAVGVDQASLTDRTMPATAPSQNCRLTHAHECTLFVCASRQCFSCFKLSELLMPPQMQYCHVMCATNARKTSLHLGAADDLSHRIRSRGTSRVILQACELLCAFDGCHAAQSFRRSHLRLCRLRCLTHPTGNWQRS